MPFALTLKGGKSERLLYNIYMFHSLGKRVGVLYGGPSSEHDVSVESARAILSNFPEDFHPVPIYITRQGQWILDGIPADPDKALSRVDAVFNAMHGEYGENGEVQELLETAGIPYTGSGPYPSRLAMNKAVAKEFLRREGIKMPLHKTIKKGILGERELAEVFKKFSLPVVVKPLALGSSIGISIAHDFFEFKKAVGRAFEISGEVLVEEFVKGKEATCAVVDEWRGKRRKVLLPVEIIPPPHKKFFDYEAKYAGISKEECPGSFSSEEVAGIMELAEIVHRALGLRHYSRSDFIVHPSRGVYFFEVNTLPGLTEQSLLPKSLRAEGASLGEFIGHILRLALKGERR